MNSLVRSIPGVCQVAVVRGVDAATDSSPDVLFEVAHGATRAHHYDKMRAQLRGDYDDGLREFFFVNTDVGAPELAHAAASDLVAQQPQRSAVVVCCEIPRTLIDCNRSIDRDSVATGSRPGELTPGLPPWVVDADDRQLLLDRYFAYRDVVTAAMADVCGNGGHALCVHTYAPRSVDVAVDNDIVAALRAAYAPDRVGDWPLRASVDLIANGPDGELLAAAALVDRAEAEFQRTGLDVIRNGTYYLHPSTLAFEFANRYPGRTLCLEVRRDLLLDEFVPFVELEPRADCVARVAAPLATAVQQAIG